MTPAEAIARDAALCGQTVDEFLAECYRRVAPLVVQPTACDGCGIVVQGWCALLPSHLVARAYFCRACADAEDRQVWG